MSVLKATRSYEYNAICDVCGFKFKASMLKKRWDGYMVCKHDYETRHSLDFYTTRNDAHLLPWTRPDSIGEDVSPYDDSVNWALAANGGTATASSTYSSAYDPSYAINGDQQGLTWNVSGGWNDNTVRTYPDWLLVTFSEIRPVSRVVVYSVQDNYLAPSTPIDGMTGTKYVLTDFMIEVYVNNAWKTVATVFDNSLIKKTVDFGVEYTDKVKLTILDTADHVYSRVVEFEAYGILGGLDTVAIAGKAVAGIAIAGRH